MTEQHPRRVCVTGAGGFVASWLVKRLLSEGFVVHGTVRDPSDPKNAHLKKLENAAENLQLFKADLLDGNSMVSAIAGCEGVFHTASPVTLDKMPDPEVKLIAPAETGTLNVLKACSNAKVHRVVVVSSTASVFMNPNWPKDEVMDETCWSDQEYCRITENWYFLSKTLSESKALDYAEKHGLDVVTLCPPLVIGPLLQPTVNTSSSILVNLLKGVRESVDNQIMHLVDVRDVANALLLLYEKPEASGRYISSAHAIKVQDLLDMLSRLYNSFRYPKNVKEVENNYTLSSEKLKNLGWNFMPLEETLVDGIKSYKAANLLNGE